MHRSLPQQGQFCHELCAHRDRQCSAPVRVRNAPCAQDGDAELLSGTLNKITLTKTPQTQMKFHFPFLLYAWLGCGLWSSLAVQAGAVGFLRALGQAVLMAVLLLSASLQPGQMLMLGLLEEMDTLGQMQCLCHQGPAPCFWKHTGNKTCHISAKLKNASRH